MHVIVGRRSRLVAVVAVIVVALVEIASAGPIESLGLPATAAPVSLGRDFHSYPTDAGTASWRVVHAASGNAYENYLTATANGRLYNFGGTYLTYSADQGESWSQVRPITPLVGGEGAVVAAPNGDVLGVGWDTYSGDRVLAFKFTAASGTWEYTETLLHTPFFDRPWLSVIPGPVEMPTGTLPYVAMLRGGWPSKEVVYYAMDGLNYTYADTRGVFLTVNRPLAAAAAPYADWIQPHTLSTITPIPPVAGAGIRAIQNRENQLVICGGGAWRVVTSPNLQWGCLGMTTVPLPLNGRILVDSDGRFHHVVASGGGIIYSISTNAGLTWIVASQALPAGMSVEEWDFKVAGASLDVGVVAVHAHTLNNTDQDLVFKFGTGTNTPVFQRLYYLGNGDKNFGDSVGSLETRFDFTSVAILPSGKIAVSFGDLAHVAAALAVEL